MNEDLVRRIAAKEMSFVQTFRNYSETLATKIAGTLDDARLESHLEMMNEALNDHDLTTIEGKVAARSLIAEDIIVSIEDIDGLESVIGYIEGWDEDVILERAEALGITPPALPSP